MCFRYLYDNPEVEAYISAYLTQFNPDIVHITSCYTLSASVITAVHRHKFLVFSRLPISGFCVLATPCSKEMIPFVMGRMMPGNVPNVICMRQKRIVGPVGFCRIT